MVQEGGQGKEVRRDDGKEKSEDEEGEGGGGGADVVSRLARWGNGWANKLWG